MKFQILNCSNNDHQQIILHVTPQELMAVAEDMIRQAKLRTPEDIERAKKDLPNGAGFMQCSPFDQDQKETVIHFRWTPNEKGCYEMP